MIRSSFSWGCGLNEDIMVELNDSNSVPQIDTFGFRPLSFPFFPLIPMKIQSRLLERISARCGQLFDKTEETMKNHGLISKDAQKPPAANLLKRLTWLLAQMFLAFVFLLRNFPQSLKERCHAISDTCWCAIPSNLIAYKDNAIQMIRSHLPKKSTPSKTPEQTQKSDETLNPQDQKDTTSTEQAGLQQSKETINEDEHREDEGSRDLSPVKSQKSPTNVKEETSQEQSELPSRSPNVPKQSQNIAREDSEQKDSRTAENENVPRDESISLESKEGTMKKELPTSEENKEGTMKKDLSISEENKEATMKKGLSSSEENKEGTMRKDLSTSEENKETTANTKETEESENVGEDQSTRNQEHAEEEEGHQVVAEFTNDPKVLEGLSFADVVKGNTEEIAAA